MKTKALVAALLLVLAAGYQFRGELREFYQKISGNLSELQRHSIDLAQPISRVFAPPPLSTGIEDAASRLTVSGTISWTNIHRQGSGLAPLRVSTGLTIAANAKADDILARQYFEHVSPDGRDAAALTAEAGYQHVIIGENLAMGNYADDERLVAAWMASPGHRENILRDSYEEIGVAVRRGVFEGRRTWVAVQIFGKPLSSCPFPDQGLKADIERAAARMEVMAADLAERRREIDGSADKRGPEYSRKVEEYNALVEDYNRLVRQTADATVQYNNQVQLFNQCASS